MKNALDHLTFTLQIVIVVCYLLGGTLLGFLFDRQRSRKA
jgi:uncharacterized protein YneF (UPF0154 family)